MPTVRKEVETRLATLKLPTAYENVGFTPPAGEYVSVFFLAPSKLLRNVEAVGYRETGMFQVNVYTKLGIGTERSTQVVDMVKGLFPVLPKTDLFSVEEPPNEASGFPEGDHWCVPVTVRYRAEI